MLEKTGFTNIDCDGQYMFTRADFHCYSDHLEHEWFDCSIFIEGSMVNFFKYLFISQFIIEILLIFVYHMLKPYCKLLTDKDLGCF